MRSSAPPFSDDEDSRAPIHGDGYIERSEKIAKSQSCLRLVALSLAYEGRHALAPKRKREARAAHLDSALGLLEARSSFDDVTHGATQQDVPPESVGTRR